MPGLTLSRIRGLITKDTCFLGERLETMHMIIVKGLLLHGRWAKSERITQIEFQMEVLQSSDTSGVFSSLFSYDYQMTHYLKHQKCQVSLCQVGLGSQGTTAPTQVFKESTQHRIAWMDGCTRSVLKFLSNFSQDYKSKLCLKSWYKQVLSLLFIVVKRGGNKNIFKLASW